MPRRRDLRKVLLVGSGPIVIGQACEFDYSGTQACKALREEGLAVVLVNSNPATIMTDPEFADRTYIEPLMPEVVAEIIREERPDALLPTLGGQTALNLAVTLAEEGVLQACGVELIGASVEAIRKAESRALFQQAMARLGLEVPRGGTVRSVPEAEAFARELGHPVVVRPSFTLGGTGGSVARVPEELAEAVQWGLKQSPRREVLLEESVLGWKEYELEVMRDARDNVVVVCPIENLDPMGVHTGDSITVAPALTLTDKEYQRMRDAACAILREIGVSTGGANIQFAVHPRTGRLVVIEMNPRVSRSSALASKATGFPIAKIAAKLAVGYTLDEILNDITRAAPACFEPTIDYVVVKVPRFAFEKFPGAETRLTTQMKSVGEVMAIGRTFKEALQKAIRSLEIDRWGLEPQIPPPGSAPSVAEREAAQARVRQALREPGWERLWWLADGLRWGLGEAELHALTGVDPWYLGNLRELVEAEAALRARASAGDGDAGLRQALWEAKRWGFADRRLAELLGQSESWVRQARLAAGIRATFKRVDTCAAEFEARTPYLYSTYEQEDESAPTPRRKVVILGSGPNRIGQGIEFDYCCVQAAFALREEGVEAIMVNCNPETVSTDYDTSDRLYFEPLTFEEVLNVLDRERPDGAIVQFGGQTPLKLAAPLARAGVPILGTSPESIDRAEDRGRFNTLIRALGLRQPEGGSARSLAEAEAVAEQVGYPVLVRPSYVLGGRGMEIVYDRASLARFLAEAAQLSPGHPILIDRFLRDAIEVDVDAVCDGAAVLVAGVMEHVEEAGIHSGDSACCLPPFSLSPSIVQELEAQTQRLALELQVRGLINVQFAIVGEGIFVLEVNPRASRTVPFVSKATGLPLARIAARVMLGRSLQELGVTPPPPLPYVAVKEAVFPFNKLPGTDLLLGPEMKSTGEAMGIDRDFGRAFAKAQFGAGLGLPTAGTAFVSVRDPDKPRVAPAARQLAEMGFSLVATRGTAGYLAGLGIPVTVVKKVQEGPPHIVDLIRAGKITMVINTPQDVRSVEDSAAIRRTALLCEVPYFTTVAGARAAVRGIEALRKEGLRVRPLQAYHRELRGGG
ncbi:MAG: carbamoyl-phosphate synthase large subunit [Deltaproteobacteria bacterium]|nr:carbamoyl-phosphate synthase large subunit [Deltaproteobacteria bacterium]